MRDQLGHRARGHLRVHVEAERDRGNRGDRRELERIEAGVRELAGSGECIAGIADSYPVPCGFVDARLLCDVETLALMWRYRLRDRGDRLRTIHGDFHPWNVLFAEGDEFRVLDRSRGALGDPADDVASLAVNYLFYALRTAGKFEGPFAELFRRF